MEELNLHSLIATSIAKNVAKKYARKMFPEQNQHYINNYHYNYQGANMIKESEYGNHYLYDKRKVTSVLRGSPRYARKSTITRYDLPPYVLSPQPMGGSPALRNNSPLLSDSKDSSSQASHNYNQNNTIQEQQPHNEELVDKAIFATMDKEMPPPKCEELLEKIEKIVKRKTKGHCKSCIPIDSDRSPMNEEILKEIEKTPEEKIVKGKGTILMASEPKNPFNCPDINRIRFKQRLEIANKKQDFVWKAYLERMFPDVAKMKNGQSKPSPRKYIIP